MSNQEPASQVQQQLSRMDENLAALAKIIEELVDDLQTALRSARPEDEPGEVQEELVTLAHQLRTNNSNIEGAIAAIAEIRYRLEL